MQLDLYNNLLLASMYIPSSPIFINCMHKVLQLQNWNCVFVLQLAVK
jgi:hypothetical protein